ncbi:MAG TPA: beta-propeller fold lactonase family protein [Candidatus Binataceae bacterium]|nr:beta-propeller fold lactonase family protein [Candidatus Binataceae bacterium]
MTKRNLQVRVAALILGAIISATPGFTFQNFRALPESKRPRSAKDIILSFARRGTLQRTARPLPMTASPSSSCGAPLGGVLIALLVSPQPVKIPVGLYRQFSATGVYSDGSTQDLSESVKWASSNGFVASIDATGKAQVRAAGASVIRASIGTLSDSTSITGFNLIATHVYVDNAEASGLNGMANLDVLISGGLNADTQVEMGGVMPSAPALSPAQNFVYVPNSDNQIETFSVNQTTGALNVLPSIQPTGNVPVATAINGPKNTIYTVNIGSNDISAYRMNKVFGTLTPLPGSPFAAGDMPDAMVVDPSGQHAYVANMNANTVSIYTMNPNVPGALVHMSDQPLPGIMPVTMAIDVTGSFLYVVEDGTNDVAAFRIDGSNGSLAPVPGSPFAAGSYPFSIAVDPSGSYAYIEAYGFILGYSINPANGALTSIGSFNVNEDVNSIIIDPSGHYLYTADWQFGPTPGDMETLAINPISGALTFVQQMPFNGYPGNMAVLAH